MPRILQLVAIAFLFTAIAAHADDASKRAKIDEMFKVIKMERNLNQILDMSMTQSQKMAKGMFGDVKISDADQKLIDNSTAKSTALLRETLSWEKLRPAYIDLYASSYTEEEIDGILAFYKSPVGQSMLSKTPELMTKGNEIVNLRAQEMQPRLRAIMEDLFKQITAAHADKAPAK